ncbi:MAG: hypothetical protein CMJ31_04045 [Phycisphaerae bacterium]|nr:hypothetical protein [Phycisphaerae bacterium]
MVTQSPTPNAELRFETHARDVLLGVQSTIRSLVEATPGVTRRATDLQKTLGIDRTLAWQIHKAAYAEDPFAAGQRLAGPAAMARFLKASAQRGAPAAQVDAVRSAIDRFENLISEHAGSRSEFETILCGLTTEDADHVGLANRRAAYQAQRHLLGVYAEALVATYIWAPSATNPKRLDTVGLRTVSNLRRLRKGATITLAAGSSATDSGKRIGQGHIEPLVPGPSASVCDLVPAFCSTPIPEIVRIGDRESNLRLEVQTDALGARSATDLVVGQVCREVFDREPAPDNLVFGNAVSVRTPCELVVLDVLLHKDMPPLSEPVAQMLSDHRCVPSAGFSDRDCDALPIAIDPVYLGSGANALAVPELPRYAELVAFACERSGFDLDDFAVHQCRVEFPPLPSSLTMRSDRLPLDD